MNFLQRNILLFVVFITGAAVLIVEVTATRILAPYFGNTIYTFSSVIGVILAALSLGYYSGGQLADRRPSRMWFFGIIFASGISVFLLQLLVLTVLPIWGYKLSIVSGPLILSTLLFFVPGFLLGILSPFAIKLQGSLRPNEGIGSISGKVFFWSTLGSIFGSLLAGFVLIPQFGVNQIVVTVGITLVIIGLIGMLFGGLRAKTGIALMLIVVIEAVAVFILSSIATKVGVVYERDGVYTKLIVYDRELKGRPVRYLLQDRAASGAVFLDTGEMVFNYARYYALANLFKEEVKNVLVIGGGTYLLPKLLVESFPEANVDVSEIEPLLFDLGKRFFRVSKNPRLKNYIKDGRRFLYDSRKKYDLIFSDVYFALTIPPHFATEEFFKLAQDKLNAGGIFLGNFIGDFSRTPPSILLTEIKTMRAVFPNSYFFAVASPGSAEVQNIIALGIKGERGIDFASPIIQESNDETIRRLPEQLIDLKRFEFSIYPKLTDNFSPVEYIASRSLRYEFDKGMVPFGIEEIKAIIAQQLRYYLEESDAGRRQKMQDFLIAEMKALSDRVEIQKGKRDIQNGNGVESVNVIGHFFPEKEKKVIISAYYNENPDGNAVLLEIARYLANTESNPAVGVDIAFFGNHAQEKIENLYPDVKSLTVILVGSACKNELSIGSEITSINNRPSRSEEDIFDKCKEKNLEKTYSTILESVYSF